VPLKFFFDFFDGYDWARKDSVSGKQKLQIFEQDSFAREGSLTLSVAVVGLRAYALSTVRNVEARSKNSKFLNRTASRGKGR
jgi:hypothetical protein